MLDEKPPPIKTATAAGPIPAKERLVFECRQMVEDFDRFCRNDCETYPDFLAPAMTRVAALLAEISGRPIAMTPGDLDIPTVDEMFPRDGEVARG
jgi:hypothetical protein